MQKYLILFIIFLFNKITFYNDFMTFMSLGVFDNCSNIASTTFCWDGEHASGSTYATAASGTINGVATGATIHRDYAYSGDYGVLLGAKNNEVAFTIVDNTDMDAAQGTLWLRLFTPVTATGHSEVWRNRRDNDNRMYSYHTVNRNITFAHEGATFFRYLTTTATCDANAWNLVGYSWSTTATTYGQISIKINDGSWELFWGTALVPVTDFTLAQLKIGGVAYNDDLWVDNFAVKSGYQTAY